jgi:uncharacterized protein involved in exopolysaccharide biosynthesis
LASEFPDGLTNNNIRELEAEIRRQLADVQRSYGPEPSTRTSDKR